MGDEVARVGRAGLLGKENLTTGEAARVLCVSPQVVIRCIDDGSLAGWKVPGSRARRVRTADLVAFAEANGVPLPCPVSTPSAEGVEAFPARAMSADPPHDLDGRPRSGGHPGPAGNNHQANTE